MSYERKQIDNLGLAIKLEAMFRLKPPYVPTTRKQFVKEQTIAGIMRAENGDLLAPNRHGDWIAIAEHNHSVARWCVQPTPASILAKRRWFTDLHAAIEYVAQAKYEASKP